MSNPSPPRVHPLSQLSANEIRRSSVLVRALHPPEFGLDFKSITLNEPNKKLVLEFLDAEHSRRPTPPVIDRESIVSYYVKGNEQPYEALLNVTKDTVVYNRQLGPNVHGRPDELEIEAVKKLVLEDSNVNEEIRNLGIDDMSLVVCAVWIYGTDATNNYRRMFQCYLYLRDPGNPSELDSNYYAFPLPISPVVEAVGQRIIRIDRLPTGADRTLKPGEQYKPPPPNEYMPQYQTLRKDLKPLIVIQPDGASFEIGEESGSQTLKWQKWYFRINFNGREGMMLYDVRYDGRPLFYRISLSELNVSYADPRNPFHRKCAFDLGDHGAGYSANNLKLGCDCLGAIYYLSAYLSTGDGDVMLKENCICIHEQDNGIGWKHTNPRTGNAGITRNRELVLQSIITLNNYDYVFAFVFNQAGEISYEVRATGILSTQPIDKDISVPWGTFMHPGVLASHHQHFFSLRLDPMIDGIQNRVVYEEALGIPRSDFNLHGTGYYTEETAIYKSGGFDLDSSKGRVFKIQNSQVLNPVNKEPVGYKVVVPDFQKIIADPGSYNYKRTPFADHNIYVTKYKKNELYAAGRYTNQSRGGDGLRTWANRKDKVVNEDIVIWIQFAINHIPRVEDFPVMPCDTLRVCLKPVNFFDKNPALDVPPPTQERNGSCTLS
ncbi:hypothetical protein P152DRAFT_435079 [Eremomyces bilateralis CBS 781.70]|uniref:Amine oxidase n=1 Tax=Eremomyces bilateralis CBS 781.70 TaxID=1392243 RepID=A0A6G1G4H6_9PEZI|nr:uncharacterized protein P152DRAFT_435079 [Eremomyces bilateralis CBS 781.70]KAF1812851.1 hypothetical protein P152DRAFT_435079 [Eremomyces bilateralis CBS 781.70]